MVHHWVLLINYLFFKTYLRFGKLISVLGIVNSIYFIFFHFRSPLVSFEVLHGYQLNKIHI
jgi:hypothetical protein